MRFVAFFCSFYLLAGTRVSQAQPSASAWEVLRTAALTASNPDHRKEAVAAMEVIGPSPQAIQLLENVLKNDKDHIVRQTAATVLGDMKATAAIPALKAAAAEDPSGEVAFSAAKALWDLGDPSGRETFIEILTRERKDGTGFITGAMEDAKRTMRDPKKLAMMGATEASGALLGPFSMGFTVARGMMKDSGAPGRALAEQYLAKDCDARSLQLLEWALNEDGNWLVKAAAAQGLGKCGDAKAVPMLERYLSDSHEPLKYQAAAAIIRLAPVNSPTPGAAT